jgi:hypothetical protein
MSTGLAMVSALCLGIEMLISFPRHTTRTATVGKSFGTSFELRVESISTSSNGMAYWVQGRPVPVLEATGREDVLLASSLHNIVRTVPVIVEGPFGPNIGIASWLYDRLIKERKREHPVQVPAVDKLCLVADSTGLSRSMSLWAWHKTSIPLLITSTTPELFKEYFGKHEIIDETASSDRLEERVRYYSGESRLIVICGKPNFQSKVEEWAASYPTINR